MKKILGIILSIVCCMALAACAPQEAPTTGGKTDKSDKNAPTVIESKDISELSTTFYVYDKMDEAKNGRYTFEISQVDGKAVLKTSGKYEHQVEMTKDDLAGVQSIIDEAELVKKNGYDVVTAGLAPEYGPTSIEVNYASGERLYCRYDGDPREDWTNNLKDYFEEILINAGFEDVKPAAEATTIKKFSIEFNVEDTAYQYGETQGSSGENSVYRVVFDLEKNQEVSYVEAEMTEDFHEKLQSIIEECGMDALHDDTTVTFLCEWTKDGFLAIYVDYENGRQIYGEYGSDTLPKEWQEIRTPLMDFLDDYIQEHLLDEAE